MNHFCDDSEWSHHLWWGPCDAVSNTLVHHWSVGSRFFGRWFFGFHIGAIWGFHCWTGMECIDCMMISVLMSLITSPFWISKKSYWSGGINWAARTFPCYSWLNTCCIINIAGGIPNWTCCPMHLGKTTMFSNQLIYAQLIMSASYSSTAAASSPVMLGCHLARFCLLRFSPCTASGGWPGRGYPLVN